ncbi:30S ribosomal protein S17e [uncultured archaeon]|nr:30S ribosomal protein S17e [uncultured archaeon]
MGKSVAKGLKYRGEVLLEEFPEEFGKDFVKNKAALNKIPEMKLSKTTRNILAGYIVREAKKKEAAKLV